MLRGYAELHRMDTLQEWNHFRSVERDSLLAERFKRYLESTDRNTGSDVTEIRNGQRFIALLFPRVGII